MKQILVISGKGGTGKTILTASFANLAENKVMADSDVDAADLHLILHPKIKEKHEFKGLPKAFINQEKCTGCGECAKVCRYGAVVNIDARYKMQDTRYKNKKNNLQFLIDASSCEGCAICMHVCPVDAISMKDTISGEWYISKTKYGPMVHAKLGIAEENSGKLVSVVRQHAKSLAQEKNLDYVIIDGPPGIGCPVIASLSGIDIALIVTEPTLSGIHDMERVISVAKHFGVQVACVINKFDINLDNTKNIESWCQINNVPIIGKIPYDQSVTESIVHGVPLVEYAENRVAYEIKNIWNTLSKVQ
ncbi:ATP-binding protein [candidate division WOR-3 bacterium]|nr:ATP-binding protein [candidate division WOR-3 bacterium]